MNGIYYSLPKALLPVRLSERSGELIITVQQPIYVADQRHSYVMRYRPSPLSSDSLNMSVDPATGLLASVTMTAEDKIREIFIEIAKAVAVFAEAAEAEEVVLLKRRIDPADETEVAQLEADMNRIAADRGRLAYIAQKCSSSSISDPCASYSELMTGRAIRLRVSRPLLATSATTTDCTVGLCYRMPADYGIQFDFASRYQCQQRVALPNATPAIALSLNRSPFVTRVNTAQLQNGVLQRWEVKKPSEALALASLPVELVRAYITVLTDFLKLRVDLSDQQRALLESEKKLAEAELAARSAAASRAEASVSARPLLVGGSQGTSRRSPLPRPTPPPSPAPSSLRPPPGQPAGPSV